MNDPSVNVSVVIPTFNRLKLLMETIASVVKQTTKPKEIIVVDNGTDDATERALYNSDQVIYLRVPPEGVQLARNAGIRAASSTWITMLDDDDLLRANFFECVAPAILDGRANAILTNHRKFNDEFSEAATHPKSNFENAPDNYWDGVMDFETSSGWSFIDHFPEERLLKFIGFYPSGMLFTKALALELGGYDPGVRGIGPEDIEFLTRLLPRAHVAVVLEAVVDYRVHSGNSTADWISQAIGRWKAFEYVYKKNGHDSAKLSLALEQDLPQRRQDVFDLAFRKLRFQDVLAVSKSLRQEDLTPKRRIKLVAANLAQGLRVQRT